MRSASPSSASEARIGDLRLRARDQRPRRRPTSLARRAAQGPDLVAERRQVTGPQRSASV